MWAAVGCTACCNLAGLTLGAMGRVLDPGVFLQPLGDKFMRLALQLLARYSSWLTAGLQQPGASEPQPADADAEQAWPWQTQPL